MKTIHFILTGGTIDSYYDGTKDTAVPNEKSAIPKYIESLRLYEKFIFTEICMKDSRELSQTDVKKIIKTVEESSSKMMIITHGTYTMPDSARFLKANLKRKDQTIIFTGSMIPLIGFAPSDASFNLGFAISEVQRLSPGIYVAMNGKIFSPDEIMKMLREGRFVSIFGEKK